MPRKRSRERLEHIGSSTHISSRYVGVVFVLILFAVWPIVLYQWISGGLNPSPNKISGTPGILRQEHELSGSLSLVDFDPSKSKGSFLLTVSGPSSLPKEYTSVKYKWIFIDTLPSSLGGGEQLILPTKDREKELTPSGSQGSILVNRDLEIDFRLSGYYPFENYASYIGLWVLGEYEKPNGQVDVINAPVLIDFDYLRSQYEIESSSKIEEIDAPVSFEGYPEARMAGKINISLKEPLFIKLALPIIFSFLFLVSVLVLALGKDISNILEISVSVFLGTWGASELLIPNNIAYPARQGVQMSILSIFLILGLSILVWAVRRLTSPKSLDAEENHRF